MILFASDFDNTLYYHAEPHFKEKDIEAIKEFQRKGNLFGICTGRPKHSVIIPSEGFVDYDFYVCETGSHITLKDGTELKNEPIPFDVVKKLMNEYEEYVDSIHNDYRFNLYKKTMDNPLVKTINSVDELKESVVHQVTLRCTDPIKADKLAKAIEHDYPLHAFVNVNNIDIVMNSCDKGSGLVLIQKYYNEKIAFIGDAENDLPGLMAADISFTFNASKEDVKKQADVLVNELAEAIAYLEEEV